MNQPLSFSPRSGGCTCGHRDESTPVLDARQIPHAVRHAAIFGALDSIAEGGTLVLVAPHEPLPLLAQVEQRYQGGYSYDTHEVAEGEWRVRFTRTR